MRIKANPGGFKEGRFIFEAGKNYEIPDRRSYVVSHGWATELPDDDPEPFETVTLGQMTPHAPLAPAADVTLSVQDSVHITAGDVGVLDLSGGV